MKKHLKLQQKSFIVFVQGNTTVPRDPEPSEQKMLLIFL
jgi:hypothetical protein